MIAVEEEESCAAFTLDEAWAIVIVFFVFPGAINHPDACFEIVMREAISRQPESQVVMRTCLPREKESRDRWSCTSRLIESD